MGLQMMQAMMDRLTLVVVRNPCEHRMPADPEKLAEFEPTRVVPPAEPGDYRIGPADGAGLSPTQ